MLIKQLTAFALHDHQNFGIESDVELLHVSSLFYLFLNLLLSILLTYKST